MHANGYDEGWLENRDQSDEELPAGRELSLRWRPVRERRRPGWVRRADIPEDRFILELELAKDPMDDRCGVLDPTARIVA